MGDSRTLGWDESGTGLEGTCCHCPAQMPQPLHLKELGHLERLRRWGRGPWEEETAGGLRQEGEDTIPWEYVDRVMSSREPR